MRHFESKEQYKLMMTPIKPGTIKSENVIRDRNYFIALVETADERMAVEKPHATRRKRKSSPISRRSWSRREEG